MLELVEQGRSASEARCRLLEAEIARLHRRLRESEPTPSICASCHYFCGEETQQGVLVCSLHPTGNGGNCGDFKASKPC